MKVLFVVPKNKSLFGAKGLTAYPHVGIAYLCAFLKTKDVEVLVFDEGIEKNSELLLEMINKFNPDLIGITIFSYCYGFAYNLIQKLKENTSLPIVAGGPHVSAVRTKIIAEAGVDLSIPLIELTLASGQLTTSSSGVVYTIGSLANLDDGGTYDKDTTLIESEIFNDQSDAELKDFMHEIVTEACRILSD